MERRLVPGGRREDKPLDVDAAKSKLQEALKALDALLATVPDSVLERSRRVLEVARAKERAAEQEAEPAPAPVVEEAEAAAAPSGPPAEAPSVAAVDAAVVDEAVSAPAAAAAASP